MLKRHLVGLLLAVTALSELSYGQVSTASITGTVQDVSGATVADSQLTATDRDTGISRTVTSGQDGRFTIPSLPVGVYSIEVTKTGFGTFRQTGIVLEVSEAASIPIVLKPGDVSQSVTIKADAEMVNPVENSLDRVVGQRQVEDLPLNGRNPANLVFLTGGAANPLQNSNNDTGNPALQSSLVFPTEISPAIHGVRAGSVYFSLDGANNVDPYQVSGGPFPNPDATEEFTIVSGNYGSRYVSAAGGAVNIVTKSGTNAWHGNLFEFIRNGDLNARNFFSPTPDVLKRNQFGGTIGAPIIKDRWFIFGSYQGTRLANEVTGLTAFVPTAAERAGDFSGISKSLNNPASGHAFAGNQIPASQFDPVITRLLNYIPVPNNSTGKLLYAQPQDQQDNQYVVKTDYYAGKHRLFARYFFEKFTWPGVGILNGDIIPAARGQIHAWNNGTIGDTWTPTANLVSEFRISLVRDQSETYAGESNLTFTNLGAAITPGQYPSIQQLAVSGFFSLAPGNVNNSPRRTIDVAEDLSLIKGKHQLAFGAEVQRIKQQEASDSGQNDAPTFSGVISGNAMSDFVLGQLGSFVQGSGIYMQARGVLTGFYVEDRMHVSRRLTTTLGVRWDPYSPFHSENKSIQCFLPGQKSAVYTNAPIGLDYPGDPVCNSSGTHTSLADNFQPRVGFAYQLDSSGKTVVRSGYGIYTQQFPMASFLGFGKAQPFQKTFTLTNPGTISNPWQNFPGGNPFAAGFQLTGGSLPPSNATFIEPGTAYSLIQNYHLAYIQQWSLIFERQLTANDALSLAYIGTKGTHLSLIGDDNQPVFIPGASSPTNAQQRRPYPGIGQILVQKDWGNSSYNGVEATYRHRLKAGLTLFSTVTWSKNIDDRSAPANLSLAGASELADPSNPSLRRGLSDFDQNYTWRTSSVWDIPYRKQATRVERLLLASWEATGILTVDAGFPFSISSPLNNSLTGLGQDYADVVPGTSINLSGNRSEQAKIAEYFNVLAFTGNRLGTFGNAGRNILQAPGLTNLDFSLMKRFFIAERANFLFRAEAFNALNHPEFLPPGSGLNSATFGQVTSARDPRIFQLSLKLNF